MVNLSLTPTEADGDNDELFSGKRVLLKNTPKGVFFSNHLVNVLHLDFDIDTGWHVEIHERIDRLG